jgi:hypothetical protein
MRRLVLCLLLACGGAEKKSPQITESGEQQPAKDRPPAVTPAGPAGDQCRTDYAEYVDAWSDWFDSELDSDAQAAIIAEFGQELPRRAALDEMRETADELRYEPGFELWIRALTATERAIDSCGEGAPRPARPPE